MKHLLVLFLLFASPGFAQLAVVEDIDGYVNIRKDKSKTAAVSDTLHSGQLVCITDTSAEWFGIFHDYTGKSGYMHRSRLKPVHLLPTEEQRKILVTEFNHFISYSSKLKRGLIAETDRSQRIRDRMEAALSSMVLAWPMNPDTVTLHAAFRALGASAGSASEQRMWLAARCAAQNPVLFKYVLCHEMDAVRAEVLFTVRTGIAMNTIPHEVSEPFPAIHFRQTEADELLDIFAAPCALTFQNTHDVDRITVEKEREEYRTILYEGMVSENDTSSKIKLEKGGKLTLSEDTGTISAFGYTFTLVDKPFAATSHVLFFSNNSRPMLKAIDAALFWGTDGDLPDRELAQLRVSYKGVSHTYNAGVVQGLYQPNHRTAPTSEFQHVQVYRSADKKRVYLRMYGGDGAGGYVCVWQFRDGIYKGRVIDHGF